MAFNTKEYKLPPGALIRFSGSPSDINGTPYLSWGFSHLGIQVGDIGIVIEHSKPAYLKLLVGERILKLDLRDMADMVGYIYDISLVALPNGSAERRCERWYTPKTGYR